MLPVPHKENLTLPDWLRQADAVYYLVDDPERSGYVFSTEMPSDQTCFGIVYLSRTSQKAKVLAFEYNSRLLRVYGASEEKPPTLQDLKFWVANHLEKSMAGYLSRADWAETEVLAGEHPTPSDFGGKLHSDSWLRRHYPNPLGPDQPIR